MVALGLNQEEEEADAEADAEAEHVLSDMLIGIDDPRYLRILIRLVQAKLNKFENNLEGAVEQSVSKDDKLTRSAAASSTVLYFRGLPRRIGAVDELRYDPAVGSSGVRAELEALLEPYRPWTLRMAPGSCRTFSAFVSFIGLDNRGIDGAGRASAAQMAFDHSLFLQKRIRCLFQKSNSELSRAANAHKLHNWRARWMPPPGAVVFTMSAVRVGAAEYRFPTPRHLERLLRLHHSDERAHLAPLLDVISAPLCGHGKEISEAFGVVAAALDAAWSRGLSLASRKVHWYTPGDGSRPFTAAAALLSAPKGLLADAGARKIGSLVDAYSSTMLCGSKSKNMTESTPGSRSHKQPAVRRPHWSAWAIDPRMAYQSSSLGPWAQNLHLCPCRSEDFEIPPRAEIGCTESHGDSTVVGAVEADPCLDDAGREDDLPIVSVVLAVHSHCPLGEFYDRVPKPKFCVTLPCCGSCGFLPGRTPEKSWEDPDIFSPRRLLHLYTDLDSCA